MRHGLLTFIVGAFLTTTAAVVAAAVNDSVGGACGEWVVLVRADGTALVCVDGKYRKPIRRAAVETFSALSPSGNKVGDIRKVLAFDRDYLWDSRKWLPFDPLPQNFDDR